MDKQLYDGRSGMNYLVCLFLCLFFSGCIEKQADYKQEALEHQEALIDESQYPIVNLNELCPNELALLVKPDNNWEVNLDSIKDFHDFASLRSQKRIHYFSTKEGQNHTDSINSDLSYLQRGDNMYTGVQPFIQIENIDVSLSPVLIPSGAGFFPRIEEVFHIFYIDKAQFIRHQYSKKIETFFANIDDAIASRNDDFPNFSNLDGPIVYLHLNKESFSKMKDAIKFISLAYLKGVNRIVLDKHHKSICELDHHQIEEIKKKYYLRIRLLPVQKH